ncbi:MAG: HAMP domain-containing histidine kinase, partial [Myxococcales bacterium]|nr:HAMP domain-containing histidine kinase [Myxococcales bacterium]
MSGYMKVLDYFTERKGSMPEDMKQGFDEIVEREDLDYTRKDSGELVKSFEEGSNRIARIVADLRQYSRGDDESFEPCDIHELLDSTLNILHNKIKHNIIVHKEYGNLPPVRCNPGRIGQVVMNLTSNAADAITGKGNIWITTVSNKKQVTITIRDDGPGIPQGIQAKIFDPFFTTKPVGTGTGLGLSISY